jgi:glucose/mannose transport system permease protein
MASTASTVYTPKQWRRYTVRTVLYVMLIVMTLVFLLPVYLVVVTSLKNPAEINLATTWAPPSELYWQSFSEVMTAFGPRLRNSVALVIGATVLSSVLGSLNGYVLSKWRIPGEKILFPLMLFGMFIPYQAILIPLFEFMRSIGLYGGVPGLILIHTVYGLPITTLIFRNFYVDIPDEMLEAAAIDGADFFGIYTNVVFPLSIPGFVVVVIWQFTQIWNEFLFGVTMTANDAQPITVGLAQLAGGEAVKWNLPMAGAIVAALPPLLVYIVLGRYFIRGLLAGSVKG